MPLPLSFLYVPAHRADLLAKAFAGPAGGVIIDLEDGLPVAEKENGRRTAARFIEEHPAHRAQLWLRIDSQELDAGLGLAQDIDPVGAFIAKADVSAVEQAVTRLPGVSTIPLIESATALDAVSDIARVAGVRTLAIGMVDLLADMRIAADAPAHIIDSLLLRIVAAAAAAGCDAPVAPTSTDFRDLHAFRVRTRELATLGFRSRTAVHPAQVAVINETLTPSPDDVAAARQLLSALDGAAIAVGADGRMIDAAVVRAAHEVISRVV